MSHYFMNDNELKNKPYYLAININDLEFKFESDNGVFSKNEIDYGSYLLVTTFLKNYTNGRVLDLGCGYGFIGIVISGLKKQPVDMVDINERAVMLTTKNIKLNKVDANCLISDGFAAVRNRYDFIITNPPIRIGKNSMYKILFDAKNYLNESGELWLVIRKEQGAKSLIKDFSQEYEMNIILKKKNFYILQAKPLDFGQKLP